MAEALQQIEQVRAAATRELADVKSPDALEQFRIKYLGSKGAVKNLMTLLGQVPKEQKREVGQRANAVKDEVTSAFEQRKSELSKVSTESAEDVTEPGKLPAIGNRHILMQVQDELVEFFERMGFSVATGPDVEDDWHNFVALNVPDGHPARDAHDSFYVGENMLLRTHTSPVQIRVMQSQKPPIRVVIPGRCYRNDTTDMTHLPMFHQIEALVVDENISMVDLKSTIMQFVHAYFGPQTKVRFRPSFFPFTEPSAEVDLWFEDKKKWIELGGCGMVHPNVFKAVNIDPEKYSGWAFGLGIERIAMRKYGINDIRLFVENDIRFLKQF